MKSFITTALIPPYNTTTNFTQHNSAFSFFQNPNLSLKSLPVLAANCCQYSQFAMEEDDLKWAKNSENCHILFNKMMENLSDYNCVTLVTEFRFHK